MRTGEFSAQICRIWRSEAQTALELAQLYGDSAEIHYKNGAIHRAHIYNDLVASRLSICDINVECISKRLANVRQMIDILDPADAKDQQRIDELMRAKASIAISLRQARDASAKIMRIYSFTYTLLHEHNIQRIQEKEDNDRRTETPAGDEPTDDHV